MANIPEKCSRCRAPIDWDDGAAFTKCEFCGFKNYLTNDDQSKIYIKDSKKLKIFNFKNQINNSLKNSLGFFESKAKRTKNLVYKNKRIFIYIILAGVFTSIAIPSIKNYSNFVATKREQNLYPKNSIKLLAIPPTTIMLSNLVIRFLKTLILVEILDPPIIQVIGLIISDVIFLRASNSRSS